MALDKNLERAKANARRRIEKISEDVTSGYMTAEKGNTEISSLYNFITTIDSGKIEVDDGEYRYDGKKILIGDGKLNSVENILFAASSLNKKTPVSSGRTTNDSALNRAISNARSQISRVSSAVSAGKLSAVDGNSQINQLNSLIVNIQSGNVESRLGKYYIGGVDIGLQNGNSVTGIANVASKVPSSTRPVTAPTNTATAPISASTSVGVTPISTPTSTRQTSTISTTDVSPVNQDATGIVSSTGQVASNTTTPTPVSTYTPPINRSRDRISYQVSGGVGDISGDVRGFQSLYNRYAKDNKLPSLQEDGIYGKQTEAAIKVWNENNPNSKVNIDKYTIEQPDINSSKNFIKSLGLDTSLGLPPTVFDPLATATSFDKKTGKMTYGDSTVQGIIDRSSKNVFEKLSQNVKATTTERVPETEKNMPKEDQRYRTNNILSTVGDIATIGMGAMMASQTVDDYEKPQEYIDALNTLKERSTQGFTSTEQSAINQQIENRYAQDVNAITQAVGGGGSQASVLAGLTNASRNAQQTTLDSALKGIQLQRQNESQYQNAIQRDMAFDFDMWREDRNMGLAARRAGANLIEQGRESIASRALYNDMYGEDSVYDRARQAQADSIQNYINTRENMGQSYYGGLGQGSINNTYTPPPQQTVGLGNSYVSQNILQMALDIDSQVQAARLKQSQNNGK